MSERAPEDPRLAAAEEVLRREGVVGARVSAAGHQREIAVVEVEADALARLAELAPEIKALGFRYVAIDLASPR
ncbi:MAG TPA: hypothetical protein VFQ38_14580 [Longimicrobiales bacterium]|nr:hypothetical protein [Longimicrobiales bacterium]